MSVVVKVSRMNLGTGNGSLSFVQSSRKRDLPSSSLVCLEFDDRGSALDFSGMAPSMSFVLHEANCTSKSRSIPSW